MSPDKRAQAVQDSMLDSLDDLDPDFRLRAEETGRRLAKEHGLLGAEHS